MHLQRLFSLIWTAVHVFEYTQTPPLCEALVSDISLLVKMNSNEFGRIGGIVILGIVASALAAVTTGGGKFTNDFIY